jgi:hypothetical protein
MSRIIYRFWELSFTIGFPMGLAKTEEEWQARASSFLKAKMKEKEVTYVELVKRLKKHGFKETEASITMKLKRGTFAATFMLACLAALEMDGVRLEDI